LSDEISATAPPAASCSIAMTPYLGAVAAE
jgi:hypothetical protein